jgi:hypothetical protein
MSECPNCGTELACGCKSCNCSVPRRETLPYDALGCSVCGFAAHIDTWEEFSLWSYEYPYRAWIFKWWNRLVYSITKRVKHGLLHLVY